MCHTVQIVDDDECEISPVEDFVSGLQLESGRNIDVVQDTAHVFIDDTAGFECGELCNKL